jgi:hypothetical protein
LFMLGNSHPIVLANVRAHALHIFVGFRTL